MFVTSTRVNEAYQAKNPIALYPTWRIPEDDPRWYENRDITLCYLSWFTSQDSKYLALALEEKVMIPATFGGDRNRLRQDSFDFVLMYDLLKEHMSIAQRTVWTERILSMYEEMKNCRVGDWDECLSYLGTWKLMEKVLHQSFVLQPVESWVHELANSYKSFMDASSEYALNTGGLHAMHGAVLGRDAFPWFEEWIKGFSDYLWQSLAYDNKCWERHGDTEHKDNLKFHRVGLHWLVHSFTKEPQLLATANKIIGDIPTSPSNLYPLSNLLGLLFVDPFEVLKPTEPLKTGTFFNVGGFVMHKMQNETLYADYLERFPEDHGYMGSTVNVRWYRHGSPILEVPGGYGPRSNEPHNHNGFLFKNCGWFWKRQLQETVLVDGGFYVSGASFGPNPRFYEVDEMQGSENDFFGCKIETEIYYKEEALTIEHTWSAPGDTFPHWTGDRPTVTQFMHSRHPMELITNRNVRWYDPVHGWIYLQSNYPARLIEKEIHGTIWHVALFETPADENSGRMSVTVSFVPPPVPEPPPPPVELMVYADGDTTYRVFDDHIEVIRNIPRVS